ncbi:peptidoglycan-binding domain-containing protein [Marivita hallyeonensis]|uniref:Putative peptidoglycan binding domain-containing protein n=1 Tax=Marivita hallyeonensis TaxID=996342 RepID=A0A1M5W697_9RHOB|nr:peptidoglycan-binding domain-containing protein [Marivita hallyeonensis]SHH82995.1 Putative peptidoglycan binding domain-containing protein [Marivita hallyeonensis]
MTRPPTVIRAVCAVVLTGYLCACTSTSGFDDGPSDLDVPDFASAQIPPPPGVNPGGCWVRDVAPAELQTVTRQIEVSPAEMAPDGTLLKPARFRTETAQVIVRERQELIFETPCPADMTREFISTLQRALDARGLYRGPITGEMDVFTLRAVRRYQSGQGLPSGLLSLQSARRLGLLTTPRDQL